MFLTVEELIEDKKVLLKKLRVKIDFTPTLALIWCGSDDQTKSFISAKEKMAKELEVNMLVKHFPSAISQKELESVVKILSEDSQINGVVIQLPLSSHHNLERLLSILPDIKDVDNLKGFPKKNSPTAQGIVEILNHHQIKPLKHKTLIIGDGHLVGRPLSIVFQQKDWPFTHWKNSDDFSPQKLKNYSLIISCTGKPKLITKNLATDKMIVIDGSGIDVDAVEVEKTAKAVLAPKGTIGPLTVCNLFENLLKACRS